MQHSKSHSPAATADTRCLRLFTVWRAERRVAVAAVIGHVFVSECRHVLRRPDGESHVAVQRHTCAVPTM